ncbi:Alpha/beta-hydrolase lipase region [Tyrophagus putrescentiae]|nr:Alpha/beta-hydrolase lipase region [Tyrophagus putrescentiae]
MFRRLFFLVCSLLLLQNFSQQVVVLAADPDEGRTIEEIVRSHGFNLELHNVTTADGYILTLHRLVDVKEEEEVEIAGVSGQKRRWFYQTETEKKQSAKKPVIVQHGLFGSSADFLVSSPFLYANDGFAGNFSKFSQRKTGDNLGFALHLTDRYDVWLTNSRGNRYSRGHIKYSDNDHAYWRFSFDQMAQYDAPAIVEYVLKATAGVTEPSATQGTASIFALLTLQPSYADIIRPVIALAPVSTVADIKSPIRYLAPLNPVLRAVGGEFAFSSPYVNWLSKMLCRNYVEEKYICENVVFLFSGFDAAHLNCSRIPVYFQFLPSTVSTWEIAHWGQLVSSGRFARFDYGSEAENRAIYGTPQPPDFNDYLSSVPDQERLIRVLKQGGVNLVDYVVPDPRWTHIDFAIGKNAGRLVYDKVIEVLDKYTSSD